MRYFFIVFLIIFFCLFAYFSFLLSPTSFSSDLPAGKAGKIRFVVNLEEKQEDIVKRLKTEKFIRNEKIFTFIAGLMKFPGSVEPGAYNLSHWMTTIGIAKTLLFVPFQKWIILVPGLRKEQVAEKLSEKFKWGQEKTAEFLKEASEGYLFPDTYLLNVDYSSKEFVQRLMSNFNEKFDSKLQNDLLAQDVRNDTAIKIASLIERESGGDEDKALIAGIIWNRLNKGMKLQIDATSQYIKGTEGNWWPHVTPSDHKIDSPYNTYMYKGLPPTPIANPSLAAIIAAVYPADTDCFYYLHDHSKQIHCSKTYEEHLENIEKYLR